MSDKKNTDFSSKTPNPMIPSVLDISPEELHNKLQEVHLIDVRRPEEFNGEFGHIPGAQLMTLDQLDQHLTRLPKDETIVFICRSGNRSAQASAFAQSMGFNDTYNMQGGMMAWTELNFAAEEKNA